MPYWRTVASEMPPKACRFAAAVIGMGTSKAQP
jgi:hypothetical protein